MPYRASRVLLFPSRTRARCCIPVLGPKTSHHYRYAAWIQSKGLHESGPTSDKNSPRVLTKDATCLHPPCAGPEAVWPEGPASDEPGGKREPCSVCSTTRLWQSSLNLASLTSGALEPPRLLDGLLREVDHRRLTPSQPCQTIITGQTVLFTDPTDSAVPGNRALQIC